MSRQFITIVENKNLRGTHKGFCLEREILQQAIFSQIPSQGKGSSTDPGFSQGLFADVSALKAFLQIHLSFPELGQIQGGDFFSLFDLSLVRTYLKYDKSRMNEHGMKME